MISVKIVLHLFEVCSVRICICHAKMSEYKNMNYPHDAIFSRKACTPKFLQKKNIIFKRALVGDMLAPQRVSIKPLPITLVWCAFTNRGITNRHLLWT